jgi:predicted GH43/DUF377 family glycosyl hydrolase
MVAPSALGSDAIQSILAHVPEERQCIRIAYTPLSAMSLAFSKSKRRRHLEAFKPLTRPTESHLVLAPSSDWGTVKVGGGSAPVQIDEGWLSVYHGVDAIPTASGSYQMQYSAGLVVHDRMQPHRILYRSPEPIMVPSTPDELEGAVNSVVFPTLLVRRWDLGARKFDGYYGMADSKIGRFRLQLPESLLKR